MTASEVLRNARALIEKPENWTRYLYARDAKGNNAVPQSEEACAWCALGAITRVGGYEKAAPVLKRLVRDADVPHFNDTKSHAEVLDLFDRAIAAAEARGE